ncbi:hypothetical protein EW145_g1802 [Phellinidium pouzarii]|uniref:Thioesterase domain-containing protein n=1 Tax=Phellinidium pouzarii TaxID=167371 RepID=A0A4S4LEU3_9AGAM|nr:hypothetical protein EW145_g1802 [Phellinidium pouzarii]
MPATRLCILTHGSSFNHQKLQESFRNPSSPFYLAPGTQGPSSPGEGFVVPERVYTLSGEREMHTTDIDSAEAEAPTPESEAREKLTELGYDPLSFYEQRVVWGDLDSFRHVNNVRYLRYLESGRIHWMQSLAHELGGPERAHDMISGKGVSLILGEVSLRFRQPVLYPDTNKCGFTEKLCLGQLLIAHKPHNPKSTHFKCAAAIWSYTQRSLVTSSDSILVWYDYDHLKKVRPW